MAYQRKDHYYRKAKAEGKASRASYKLIQLQERFKLVRKGNKAIDLGCAPGGWLQELSKMVGPQGRVVGIDLLTIGIRLLPNVTYLQGSVENITVIAQARELLGDNADIVLSDMAPNTSGVGFADAFRSFELASMALDTCHVLLKRGGNFIVKLFPGKELEAYHTSLRRCFEKVHVVTPPATRKTSSEIYLICIGYKKTS